jgi:Domain of unknown function (DUF4132)
MGILRRLGGSRLSPELNARLDLHSGRAASVVAEVESAHAAAERAHYTAQPLGRWEAFRASPLALDEARPLRGDPDLAVSALVIACSRQTGWERSPLVSALARRNLPYAAEDVELLVRLALAKQRDYVYALLRPAVGAAERFAAAHGVELIRRPLTAALERLEREQPDSYAQDRTALLARLQALLAVGGTKVDLSLFDESEDFGRRARKLVEARFPAQGDLLFHLARATSSRPSKQWAGQARKLLDDDGLALVRRLLEEALPSASKTVHDFVYEGRHYVEREWFGDRNATVVRGAVWAVAASGPPWASEVLEPVLARAMNESVKVANACIYALGELEQPSALALLSRLKATVSDRGFLKQIEKALESAAGRAGLSKSQLRERLVPDHGLGPDGTKRVAVGAFTAIFEVGPLGRVRLSWEGSRGTPDAVKDDHPDKLRALKADASELRKTAGAERSRLEGLLAEERVWPADEWRRDYVDHPLVGAFARSLYWRFSAGERVATALGSDAPDWADEVELWHPIAETADEIARRRSEVLAREIVQPFKQAFREVYLLAPAEELTESYSNRFAAHILRYPQTYALVKQRGWGVAALGPYDNDGGRQWRDFEAQGIRAEFWLDHVDDDAQGPIDALAASDQVRFTPIGDTEPMPLVDVPRIVFSEAMRDVDLFVGVTSIAGDPEWRDHGDRRFLAYWEQASFGDLTASAEVRREALRELVPQLAIADRCSVDEKFLVVRGDLRTYKIHLGSANILMEPDDQYLCIVPARGKGPTKLFLPFPEDERLSVILSKAFLLANDRRITAPTIARQIQPRG